MKGDTRSLDYSLCKGSRMCEDCERYRIWGGGVQGLGFGCTRLRV